MHFHADRCYSSESFWKGNLETGIYSDRYYSGISGFYSVWNGRFLKHREAGVCQLPSLMHFGVQFEPSSCVALGILFAINSIQAIGDYSATTIGAMDRTPKDDELQRGIVGYGLSNVVGALLGGLPTATYSQNVGIVTTTRLSTVGYWDLQLQFSV